MEILRFGPGFRREERPAGTHGLAEQLIWGDPRARVTELAFGPHAVLPPQSSPQLGLFVVVSGGGWVQVGEERTAIHHGEAVTWPPLIGHGAWTDGTHMRAILIEVPDEPPGGILVRAVEVPGVSSSASEPSPATAARGSLAEQFGSPEGHDPIEGEPW